jgi:Fur family peroxide stress response transcriptional regulator
MKYDANLSRHDHIYSTNTQEIIDFEDEELSKIVENYINKKRIGNFKVNDIRIQIEGEKINPEKDIDII